MCTLHAVLSFRVLHVRTCVEWGVGLTHERLLVPQEAENRAALHCGATFILAKVEFAQMQMQNE
jgi:hypothetical protein